MVKDNFSLLPSILTLHHAASCRHFTTSKLLERRPKPLKPPFDLPRLKHPDLASLHLRNSVYKLARTGWFGQGYLTAHKQHFTQNQEHVQTTSNKCNLYVMTFTKLCTYTQINPKSSYVTCKIFFYTFFTHSV
jgi:hypothetical protein